MMRLIAVSLALTSAFASMVLCQGTRAADTQTLATFKIAIGQQAYTNEPVWIHAFNGPIRNVRYPFSATIGDIGCNNLELRRNGVVLKPRTIALETHQEGIVCGSSAPIGSPSGQLPLHVLYPFNKPGTYSVRWTIEEPDYTSRLHPVQLRAIAASQWLTFTVLGATSEQRAQWLNGLLAHPPEDPGELAGEFLPSLAAAAPDQRALSAFLGYLYADNEVVADEAASALELFPQPEVMRAVISVIDERGPNDQLAYYATSHMGWTSANEAEVVHAAAKHLVPPATPRIASDRPSWAPTATSASIKLVGFIFYTPNHAWPSDAQLKSWTDTEVLSAAPDIMARGTVEEVQQLAEYLGEMQQTADSHALLLRIAGRGDSAGEQARICLKWHRTH